MDLKNIAELPGVYLWKDINDNVIYVGKSKNLKKRMAQYFAGSINSFKTIKMVSKINGYETIICNNENESLILERNLIQKYKPFYNVFLLDDKKYPYINISLNKKGLFISLKYLVKSENKHNVFYGPYLNNGGSRVILNFLKRECFYNKGLPIKEENYEFWNKKFLLAKKILSKTNISFIDELTKKMLFASNKEQFEIANDFKEVIQFLSLQKKVQIVDLKNNENLDVLVGINYQNFILFCIQFYRSGSLISSDVYPIEIIISKKDTIRQFINQFYQNKQLPTLIITNLIIDINNIYFKTKIVIPQRGKYFSILNLGIKNAKQNMDLKILEYKEKKKIVNHGLNFLKKIINVNNVNHIIMIDNSNTKNSNPVSVIVSYRNGLPKKEEYAKFNITLTNRKSDVEYIKQGLEKYFRKIVVRPNLLIVDGGIQQLNESKKTLNKLNIFDVPIIGLVKNEKHKTESIILENGKKIAIEKDAYNFLSNIQEDVDRFAKVVHRKKNSKSSLEGKLIKIKGIGPKTELKILDFFKTYNNIYNANLNELEKIVSKKIAQKIINSLKN